MKCSKEYRNWINKVRKKHGRKNGVIKSVYLDQPVMDRKYTSLKGQGV